MIRGRRLSHRRYTVRLHAKNAKTGHGRIIPVAGALRPIIDRRLAAQRLDCPLIFHRHGRAVGDFRKRWKTACATVGVEGKLPYDLRRTAVRNMVRAGLDPTVAMRISGHRTRSMFDRYNIITELEIAAGLEQTAAYVDTLPSTTNIVPLRIELGTTR